MRAQTAIGKELIRRIFDTACDGWAFLEDLGGHVSDAFSGIRLMGEIERPEGKGTYEELKRCLGQFVDGSEEVLAEVLDCGNDQMRAALGLYFVWTGIFAYGEESGHELWPPVLEGLGIQPDPVLSNKCGRLFMECLKDNELERFAALNTRHPYVDRILLHGLIPDIHMERFIREAIYPELQSPMGLYESGDTVVRRLRQKMCQNNLTLLPKPIQRFIEHGHPVNADVIGRLLYMARECDVEPDKWQLWGLPKYMVDAFLKFTERVPTVIDRKSKTTPIGARPFLQFDLRTNDSPVLVFPPQSVPAPPQFILRYTPIHGQHEIKQPWVPGNTPIGGQHQTDHFERPVGPARDGWKIDVSIHGVSQRQFVIPYEFFVTSQGDELPIFFFNAGSGKPFNARNGRNFPEELIVLYPQEATLDFVGVQTSIDSEGLYGEWGDWQYTACSLEVEGAFKYYGPDASHSTILTESVTFGRMRDLDLPVLSGHKPPSWFRSLENLPVFTAAQPLQIHCSSHTRHLWQRGIGILTRLDVLGRSVRFELGLRQEGLSWTTSLPEPLEPGVYELRLQGALGAGEDIDYLFAYFPVARFNTVLTDAADEKSLVRYFHIEADDPLDLEAHGNTQLDHRGKGVVVSPESEGAGAFCAVRAFAGSRYPVTILLARHHARWCRRRESGLIAWEEWLARSEALPIQKVDELQDARVAVQIDQMEPADASHRPLWLFLKGTKSRTDGVEERGLMSLPARALRRETHRTWVFDLQQFSDQLKNWREYHTADITVDPGKDNGGEFLLLSLLRFPEYKDLRLTRLPSTGQTEQYRVAWTPQSNDPTTLRVLHCRPETGTDRPVSLNLEDGDQPPFSVELPAPHQAAMWTAWVSIQSSRFARGQSDAPIESQFRWFRTPDGWQDWLAWPDIRHKDLHTILGIRQAT